METKSSTIRYLAEYNHQQEILLGFLNFLWVIFFSSQLLTDLHYGNFLRMSCGLEHTLLANGLHLTHLIPLLSLILNGLFPWAALGITLTWPPKTERKHCEPQWTPSILWSSLNSINLFHSFIFSFFFLLSRLWGHLPMAYFQHPAMLLPMHTKASLLVFKKERPVTNSSLYSSLLFFLSIYSG